MIPYGPFLCLGGGDGRRLVGADLDVGAADCFEHGARSCRSVLAVCLVLLGVMLGDLANDQNCPVWRRRLRTNSEL